MKQTPNISLPILEQGDKYLKETQNEAFSVIDREIAGLNIRIETLDNVEGNIIDTKSDVETLKNETNTLKASLNDVESNAIPNIQTSLDNIEIHLSDYYNALNFGVVNGSQSEPIDVSEQIQNMIDECIRVNQKRIKFPTGHYFISKSIVIPKNCFIDFNGSTIRPFGDINNFTDKFMFILGDYNTGELSDTYASIDVKIKNLRIMNVINNATSLEGIKGFYVGCRVKIDNIYTSHMYNTITIRDRYIDQIELRNIAIISQLGSDYQIKQINGSYGGNLSTTRGDSWIIENIHIMSEATNNNKAGLVNRPLINFTGTNSAVKIRNVLNGTIRLEQGDFQLDNIYIETGGLIINNAFVDISNSYFYKETNVAPILISGENNSKNINFKNIKFGYKAHRNDSLTKGRFYPCILIRDTYDGTITIENCSQGMPREFNSRFGIKIAHYSGAYDMYREYVPFDYFNDNSHTLSKHCVFNKTSILYPCNISSSYEATEFITCSKAQLPTTVDRVPLKWQLEDGTYSYRFSIVVDDHRNIGYTNSKIINYEMKKNEENILSFKIKNDILYKFKNITIVIERGKDGEFTEYCYVPMMYTNSIMYDNGLTVSGLRWINGQLNKTLKPATLIEKNLIMDNVTIYGGNTNVTGTWRKFDRVQQVNPNVGSTKGWVYNGTSWISEGTY